MRPRVRGHVPEGRGSVAGVRRGSLAQHPAQPFTYAFHPQGRGQSRYPLRMRKTKLHEVSCWLGGNREEGTPPWRAVHVKRA